MSRPGSPVTGRRDAGARLVAAPASSSPTRSTDWWRLASPPITTASRAPARSACCSTSVDSSYTANTDAELRRASS